MSCMRARITQFAIAILLGTITVQLGGCSSHSQVTPEELARADFGTLPPNYQDQIRGWFAGKLFDPHSAQYGFDEPTKQKYDGQYGWHIMVVVNAKNRLGGYVGAKQYNFFFPNGGSLRQVDVFATELINGM